ncbi:CD209 antigen-like protein A [Salmo salar]|uniref:CD209 antigen-like protein A n=1 Tax=Salmo salar TaxID=8030 RepID=B9EPI6_SALSA|nr:CD209 antigen-like protein A [Salmo salar]ACM09433.1 CD209 antigen-like protein A [Salmo salar]|eukprot:NP_001140055.1 CD209 antigen-like protein A [Salmo salar]
MDNDENIYANASSSRASPREGAIYFQWWKRPSRAAAVCLGLLCVLLLAGIISLSVYQRNQSTSYNNLTKARDQLQKERDQLQKERDQLQKEKENLNKKIKGRRCPEGWREFEFSCYYITNENKAWSQSREECHEFGADLVIINSKEEQVFINGLNQTKNHVWIGLTDSVIEGTWKWVDGTPLTTANWGKGQPNSNKGIDQDCGAIWDHSGWWNDEKCLSKHKGICEK